MKDITNVEIKNYKGELVVGDKKIDISIEVKEVPIKKIVKLSEIQTI